MLLLLLENKCKLNEVVFYDTGMEFNAIYSTRDRVKALLKELNIKSEKAYNALLKDYKLLSSESLKYICQTRSFYEIIEIAKEA